MDQNNQADIQAQHACILVADDYDVNRSITQLMLQKAGYVVDVVENGQQAVEACRQKPYDLILMDIQMPILDGYEATKKIRNSIGKKSDPDSDFQIPTSDCNEIPIIAMTGKAGEESFDEKHYPGMNDCIGKPLRFDRLLSVVRKWLDPKPDYKVYKDPAGASDSITTGSEENQFPLDLDRAIQEFMGKKEIFLGVLQKFIVSAAARIDNIRQAVTTADYQVIGLEAHGLMGGAANLKADKLANLAADLEKAGQEQQPDLTAELAEKLAQEFYNLEKYVQQYPEMGA